MRTSGDSYKNQIKIEIKSIIDKNYINGKYTRLKDLQSKMQKDFKISEGQVHILINDLLNDKKISTFYDNGRYYAPPRIPVAIKIGVAMAAVTTAFWMAVDIFIPSNLIYRYIYLSSDIYETPEIAHFSTVPFVIYSLIIITVFTFLMVFSTKKHLSNKV